GSCDATSPGGVSTCTITVDVTPHAYGIYNPVSANVTADDLAPFSLSAPVDVKEVGPAQPSVLFSPNGYQLSPGEPASGVVNVGYAALGDEQIVTIASVEAVISDPQLLNTSSGASCVVAPAGEAITISIIQQFSPLGSC